jgi:hypothetical protein
VRRDARQGHPCLARESKSDNKETALRATRCSILAGVRVVESKHSNRVRSLSYLEEVGEEEQETGEEEEEAE